MTRTEELLTDKEIRGLRITFFVKILFLIFLILSSFSPEASFFEKAIGSGFCITLILFTIVLLFLLKKRKKLILIGVIGAIIDGLVIGMFPIIWYLSVGGSEVSPAYLLKTMLPVIAIALIIINSLAIRPIYPLIVSAGYFLVHVGFYVFASQDERTIFTYNYVEGILGEAVHSFMYWITAVAILFLGGILAFLTHVFRKTIHEAVYLEKAKFQLQRYFSPAVANTISKAEEDFLRPGGQKQNIAVMFCDIRGFTSLSEKLSPEEVVELLSEYHSKMVEIIFRYGGTLDKFIGDGIMATFGTPEVSSDDVERAVKSGIEMRHTLHQLNLDRDIRGLTKIQHGVGIHFGPAIIGNIGTVNRLEYTVIGDTVNLASRIESACEELKEDFLISKAVKEKIGNEIKVRGIGKINVKGKSKPIQVFAVDGFIEKE